MILNFLTVGVQIVIGCSQGLRNLMSISIQVTNDLFTSKLIAGLEKDSGHLVPCINMDMHGNRG